VGNIRKNHSASFKLEVASAALSGFKTLAELSSKYGVHPAEISRWKKKLAEEGVVLFAKRQDATVRTLEQTNNEQRILIGKMALQIEALKKKQGYDFRDA
jgi:transposase-like protein